MVPQLIFETMTTKHQSLMTAEGFYAAHVVGFHYFQKGTSKKLSTTYYGRTCIVDFVVLKMLPYNTPLK